MALPGIFQSTIFSPRTPVQASTFIRPIHPKTEIRPEPAAIRRVLDQGWVGQLKIHGHRAQIHLPPTAETETAVYNRHGQLHKKELPKALDVELRRIFGTQSGFTVLDAEWLKGAGTSGDRIFVFDVLKRDGRLLDTLTYAERWELLPRVYASDSVETLGILRTVDKCLEAMRADAPYIEGLVFRSLGTPGFSDTSIVRCRKK